MGDWDFQLPDGSLVMRLSTINGNSGIFYVANEYPIFACKLWIVSRNLRISR